MTKFAKVLFLCLSIAAMAGTAQAVPMDFDFSGNFTYDNDVVIFGFTACAESWKEFTPITTSGTL